MKLLIDGVWHANAPPGAARASAFDRFRDWVSADGAGRFPAEPGRYHVYVSYACPWAHRTIIYRRLKRLERVVSMSVAHPRWAGPDGWTFGAGEMSTIDHAGGRRCLHDVYRAAKPDFTGRVTVPVLWDKKTKTIVNNESADIIRMLNTAFDAFGDATVDFYPEAHRERIDALNARLLPLVCAGVYRAGFARTQDDYERAVSALFHELDHFERTLSWQRYLLGDCITECDWHLFCTLVRFDAAYHDALKCNLRRLVDYPALCAYARRLFAVPGVADTVRIDHVKHHYHDAIDEIDRTIVPLGPSCDFRHVQLGPG